MARKSIHEQMQQLADPSLHVCMCAHTSGAQGSLRSDRLLRQGHTHSHTHTHTHTHTHDHHYIGLVPIACQHRFSKHCAILCYTSFPEIWHAIQCQRVCVQKIHVYTIHIQTHTQPHTHTQTLACARPLTHTCAHAHTHEHAHTRARTQVLEPAYLESELLPLLTGLTRDDQDSVRIVAVDKCATLGSGTVCTLQHCNTTQRCNTLQHIATHCNKLQHPATQVLHPISTVLFACHCA